MTIAKKLLVVTLTLTCGLAAASLFRKTPAHGQADSTALFGEPAAVPYGRLALRHNQVKKTPAEQPLEPVRQIGQRPERALLPSSLSRSSKGTPPYGLTTEGVAADLPKLPRDFPKGAISAPRLRPTYRTVYDRERSLSGEMADAVEQPETCIVVDGDTLARIAERCLGDPNRASEVLALNREQIDDPELLPIGAELKLPILRNSSRTHRAQEAHDPLPARSASGLIPVPGG